jgi:hypothetical protein
MPGLVLDMILNKVKHSEVEKAEKKALIEEKEREARLDGQGLKNMNMLLEEAGLARQANTNMSLDDMTGPEPVPAVETTVDKNTTDGRAVFDKFLEQIK